MINCELLQKCKIVEWQGPESSRLSAGTSFIRASRFVATVECNPVAYDINTTAEVYFVVVEPPETSCFNYGRSRFLMTKPC